MKKYLIYFNERFPFQTHIPIIGIFTFSAICFSLSAAGETTFIPLNRYLMVFCLTFGLFLVLRISDEFKDHEDDMKHRKYLPVPRGLIRLNELRNMGILVFISHLFILFFNTNILPIYLITLVYLVFMYFEFFKEEWLKKHQLAYVFSHMLIIPVVDLVASSGHWSFADINPPTALAWFFAVSFFNGILLEFGRKIKLPENEEEGVVSYSKLWGMRNAAWIWLAVLAITLTLAVAAAMAIDSPVWVYVLLVVFALAGSLSALFFLKNPTQKGAKMIENASGLWTMGMYLNLGALPFLVQNIF
jgi:4-hydroxybenzoate polyprenyltransferase